MNTWFQRFLNFQTLQNTSLKILYKPLNLSQEESLKPKPDETIVDIAIRFALQVIFDSTKVGLAAVFLTILFRALKIAVTQTTFYYKIYFAGVFVYILISGLAILFVFLFRFIRTPVMNIYFNTTAVYSNRRTEWPKYKCPPRPKPPCYEYPEFYAALRKNLDTYELPVEYQDSDYHLQYSTSPPTYHQPPELKGILKRRIYNRAGKLLVDHSKSDHRAVKTMRKRVVFLGLPGVAFNVPTDDPPGILTRQKALEKGLLKRTYTKVLKHDSDACENANL